MPSKPVTVHYRRVADRVTNTSATHNLHQLLRKAMQSPVVNDVLLESDWKERVASIEGDSQQRRFWNYHHINDEVIFGNMCQFSPGQMQALIELEKDSGEHKSLEETLKQADIAEQQAPNGREYLEAIAYFLVIQDHVFLIQSNALQSNAFEQYFTWILRDKVSMIGQGKLVRLQSEFDRSELGSDFNDIKSIQVGGIAPETFRPGTTERKSSSTVISEENIREHLGSGTAIFEKAKQVLSDILGPERATEIIASIPEDAALEVLVSFGYRARRRKFSKVFMNDIADGLRNIPDGELQVVGKDGIVKGNDARLHMKMSVRKASEESSLLDLEDALEKMLEVHRRFQYDGKIQD